MAFVRLGAVALKLGLFEDSRAALDKGIALARAQGHEAPRMEAMGLLEDLEKAEEDARVTADLRSGRASPKILLDRRSNRAASPVPLVTPRRR